MAQVDFLDERKSVMSQYEQALQPGGASQENNEQTGPRSATMDQIKTTVSKKLNEFARTLENRAQTASDNNQELGRYGSQAADWLKRSAHYIEELNPQQLTSDLSGQVRRNPGKSLLIAAAAGLLLGSLLNRR